MRDLPTGVVTFLFTDIEGSTRLLMQLGEQYGRALEVHHEVIRSALRDHDGIEFGTAGDAVFAAFISPEDGVAAAVTAQKALAGTDWPGGGAVRVRMGLHTGEAELGPTGYTGITLHETARIADAGHGGQIVVSEAVAGKVHQLLDSEVELTELGRYWLKDLTERQRLWQVEAPSLPVVFPPIRAVDVRPNNLPGDVSEFIGREAEMAALRELAIEQRLVTVVGPGGTGKTRLALHVARSLLGPFEDGVFFVPLEGLEDPETVAPAVASAIGISDTAGGDSRDALTQHLQDRKMLLLLDNFEHILDGADVVGGLLSETTGVHVIATSRSLLRLRGESVLDLPPMAGPPLDAVPDLSDLRMYDSVRLLVQRSRAVGGRLTVDAENAEPITRIVQRLDGLPLALELAAARSRDFTPQELADRLELDFEPIAEALVDLPPRQRTVSAMVRWSYDLLPPDEQAAFRQLAVFAGSFDIEAADAVLVGEISTRDTVSRLLDRSLLAIRPVVGQERFAMLQTIREFARSCRPVSEAEEAAADRHAAHFVEVGLVAEPELDGVAQNLWIERLGHDRDNFRAALRHTSTGGAPDVGARLAAAIWRYWQASGLLVEGMNWLNELLQLDGIAPETRPKALEALAGLAYWRADFAEALRRYRAALELRRDLGDLSGQAETLYGMSLTAALTGELDLAASLSDEGKTIALDLEDRAQYGRVLMAEATVFWLRGDLKSARRVWEESLDISLEQGNTALAASQMVGLSALIFQDGDVDAALRQAGEALSAATDAGNAHIQVFALDAIASYAVGSSPTDAVRMAAVADTARRVHGGGWTVESVGITPARQAAVGSLTESEIDAAWSEGTSIELDDAVAAGMRFVAESVGD